MILMIDNYDSFTYNLVQYLSEFEPDIRVFRNDKISLKKIHDLAPDHIVISPGPGRPEDAGITESLIREISPNIPTLGVCLGHQAIAQVYGGQIIYAPKIMHGKTSEIFHENTAMFRKVTSPFVATRYHSLIVNPKNIPNCLEIIARTQDNIIMALQHKTKPLWGVQFHPESIMTVFGKQILNNFLESC